LTSGPWSYEAIERVARSLEVAIPVEAIGRFDRYFQLLTVWNSRLRLTGARDPQVIIDRHASDAIAVASVLPAKGLVVDVGTGAGLPGMLLGILRPDLEFTLVDSRERPISFLREVVREIGLTNVHAEQMRAEHAPARIAPQHAAVSCAIRMDTFFRLALPLLAADGIAISMQASKLDRRTAEAMAAASGLELVRFVPYRLDDETERRLIVAGVV
jgi:16S rRNA (guanine527-N7)-methyltransferase